MYMCIFSHTLYCCYKTLPLHWAFEVLWSFSFFPLFYFFFCFFSFLCVIILIFNFLTYYILSAFIPLFAFPTVLFPLQLIFNVYKSSSSITLHIYSFFLFFALNIFVRFAFIALFPICCLALALFSSLCLR